MNGPVFGVGDIRNGRLRIRRSNVFAEQLAQLRDGPVEICIERKRATRSQQANAFYWVAVIAGIADHTGYTADECHELMKAMFLPKALAVTDGNGQIVGEYVIGGTTTRLTTAEFSDYIMRIKQWALEKLNVRIEEPTE